MQLTCTLREMFTMAKFVLLLKLQRLFYYLSLCGEGFGEGQLDGSG